MNKYQQLISTLNALKRIKDVADPTHIDITPGNKLAIVFAERVYTQYGMEAGTYRYTIKIPLFEHEAYTVTLNWSEMSHSVKHYVQAAGINADVLAEQWESTIRGE